MASGQKKSVWFLGTSSFAVPSLEALLKDPSFRVDLVITQPDRPTGRRQELTPSPVKVASESHKIKIIQPENLNDFIKSDPEPGPQPDFLIVVSFGQILSQQILDMPTIAPINVHASLLPKLRGASPLQHAILTGEKESGVTVQKMVKELDAGPILAQKKMTLDPRETAVTLHDKLADLGAKLLIKTLKHTLTPVDQDAARATVCHVLTREDGIADVQAMTAESIDRRVRAFTPWPGVTLTINGQPLKLIETALEPTDSSTPLPCANGTVLHLVKVQTAGGKPITGVEWARGNR
ncbi:methionyl-tRNA formyltransferase [Candidatus Peribacteria bacterium]|nr:methionyl-tRNA formyltransferase [Candidatus Peribacteria bacterium]